MEVSRLQDVLGKLVEGYPALFLRLGRWEADWADEALAAQAIDRPIYVTGLARSGSTILLELLAAHPDVATHRYKDFPLLQIPVWWNWFLDRASKRETAPVERAHKDRIQITPDSPEAMEEILWMAFFAKCHDPTVSNVLGEGDSAPEFEAFYRHHVRKLLLVRGGKRYLAKGNYNISRMGYLRKLFPDARFVVPVRDPVGHIASLMKQHRLFCDEETRDPRILDYMRRAGHFEFGLNRRPINLGDADTVRRIEALWQAGDEIEGWAVYWAAVYGFVADTIENDAAAARQTLLVDYEELCQEPQHVLARVYRHVELEIAAQTLQEQAARISAPSYYQSGFADDEIAVIREATEPTRLRIRGLVQAQADRIPSAPSDVA
jgi:hypothetical protein